MDLRRALKERRAVNDELAGGKGTTDYPSFWRRRDMTGTHHKPGKSLLDVPWRIRSTSFFP